MTGCDAEPVAARATSGVGAAKLDRLRLSDFEVTAGAAAAGKAVADFATPSSVIGLFEDAPMRDLFASIEANAARVRVVVNVYLCPFVAFLFFYNFLCA